MLRMQPELLLVLLCTFLLPTGTGVLAVEKPQVSVPPFDDKYSMLVRKLESGQTDIDYKEFRESFLESKQLRVAASKGQISTS